MINKFTILALMCGALMLAGAPEAQAGKNDRDSWNVGFGYNSWNDSGFVNVGYSSGRPGYGYGGHGNYGHNNYYRPPVYRPTPVYYAPAPAYCAPAPVYYRPSYRPTYYAPAPVYYQSQTWYGPGYNNCW